MSTTPKITAANFDPAMVYQVDIADGVRGYGFVTNMSHDPAEVAKPLDDTRRFFVFKPAGGYKIFSMTMQEAAEANPTTAWRKGEPEAEVLEKWLKIHYVKPE